MAYTPAQIQTLHDVFGYDIIVSAEMIGEVWMGDNFLYFIDLA